MTKVKYVRVKHNPADRYRPRAPREIELTATTFRVTSMIHLFPILMSWPAHPTAVLKCGKSWPGTGVPRTSQRGLHPASIYHSGSHCLGCAMVYSGHQCSDEPSYTGKLVSGLSTSLTRHSGKSFSCYLSRRCRKFHPAPNISRIYV